MKQYINYKVNSVSGEGTRFTAPQKKMSAVMESKGP